MAVRRGWVVLYYPLVNAYFVVAWIDLRKCGKYSL